MDPAAWSVLSYSLALNQAGRPWVQRWGMPVMNGVVLTFGTKLRWNMKHHEPFWVILFQILHFGVYDIWIYMVYRYTALSCTPNCRNLIHEKLGIDQWRIHGNGSSWKLGIPQHPHLHGNAWDKPSDGVIKSLKSRHGVPMIGVD